MSVDRTDEQFPWEIGVFDAHCHPTDTMTSIDDIPHMKTTTLTIMATRGEDQDLVYQTALRLGKKESSTTPERVIPCFGWHPWFSHRILDDSAASSSEDDEEESPNEEDRKRIHYRSVLTPSPEDDDDFISSLPDPKPLSQLIAETRHRLVEFPTALVGEVGLDRAFRLPNPWSQTEIEIRDPSVTPGSREGRMLSPYRVHVNHQKAILKAQLRLAGELRRPVSVHSVQAHGAMFDLFKELWSGHERRLLSRRERRRRRSAGLVDQEDSDSEDERRREDGARECPRPFPPRICMHSYSGPVEPLKQFLHPSNPSDVYFSFSSAINLSKPSSRKVFEVIKAVPGDRLLVESDLHTAGQQMDHLLEEVSRSICELRGWPLNQGVQQLADNWKRFVFG